MMAITTSNSMRVNRKLFFFGVGIDMFGDSLDIGENTWKQFARFKNRWIKVISLFWLLDAPIRLHDLEGEFDGQFAVAAEVSAVEVHPGIPFRMASDGGDAPLPG